MVRIKFTPPDHKYGKPYMLGIYSKYSKTSISYVRLKVAIYGIEGVRIVWVACIFKDVITM